MGFNSGFKGLKGGFLSEDYPIFWRVAANILNKQSRIAVKG